MGRVKKYSRQHSNRKKRDSNKNEADQAMTDNSLPVNKRKQIFKKKNRRDVKKRIQELRL